MARATITSKGQVTIPQQIRRLLHVEAGDQLDFVVDEQGRIILNAATADISELKGLLHRPGQRSVSVEEMNAAVLQAHGGTA
ncbi:MAG: AbrB/MazE/SpoVT family DNA-binding domain-containing protein [Mycobacteriales bacterium]